MTNRDLISLQSLKILTSTIQKNMQARAAGRIAPCRSYEQTGFTWEAWQGAGGSSDLSFWRRMLLSLSPAAAAAAGPLMRFSEKHGSWHLTTEWKCWICSLTAGIQICVYFYLTSLQRKFWKYKQMRALQKKELIYRLFPSTVSLSWFLKKMDIWGPKFYKKNTSCGLLDFCISPWPICMDLFTG